MGLTYERTLCMPIGELLDLIAIQQIEDGQATYKRQLTEAEEEADFWRQMDYV